MSRTGLREQIFKILYSIEIQSKEEEINDIEEIIDLYIESNNIENEEQKKEIKDMLLDIYKYNNELNDKIIIYLKDGWKLDRVSKINIAILKLSIYELKYTNTPFKIVINEAVKIAKRFGDEYSTKYVNGILAKIVEENEKIETAEDNN